MKLKRPSLEECFDVLKWRRTCPETLRTPHQITKAEQKEFHYKNSLFHEGYEPKPEHIYFSVVEHGDLDSDHLLAFTGLTYIDWVNSHAEISLIVKPSEQKRGVGKECVKLILDYARELGLNMVYGECYMCSPNVKFWQKLADNMVILPQRKLWDGRFWDSLYFTFFLEKHDGH